MSSSRNSRRTLGFVQLAVLILVVVPFVSASFRDNDQAAILSGAWQIAHHQSPFFHATFYNFDKQWGVFLALSWLYKLFPQADPVLAGNVLVTVMAGCAWLGLALRKWSTPLLLLLPILLSPVLILYMPFLGTGWLSLPLLLTAFLLLAGARSISRTSAGLAFVALAASCRADVILAIPALFLAFVPRKRFTRLIIEPRLWLLSAVAILPVLFGKWIAGVAIADKNPFSFDVRAYLGFLFFGLTPAVVLVLLLHTGAFLQAARLRARFRAFYLACAAAPFLPLAFYSPQLYTLRYLFLIIASLLFVISSRRFGVFFRKRSIHWIAVMLTTLPWVIGLQVPLLTKPRLTITNPTRFPTGDGMFPMAAYLGFVWQARFRDHMTIDHNQKIWLAARSVDYKPCPDGQVPFLVTPMSNFLEFAIRLEKKKPLPIDFMAESPCGKAYVDARSILRGIRPDRRDGPFFSYAMKFVSRTDNGQPIVYVDRNEKQTTEAGLLQELSETFKRHESEMFFRLPPRLAVTPGIQYAIFSEKDCSKSASGLVRASWTGKPGDVWFIVDPSCFASFAGWARTTLPPYMGL